MLCVRLSAGVYAGEYDTGNDAGRVEVACTHDGGEHLVQGSRDGVSDFTAHSVPGRRPGSGCHRPGRPVAQQSSGGQVHMQI